MFNWLFGRKHMEFEIKVSGVDKSKLIKIEGGFGPFFVCPMGMGIEAEDEAFFYGDAKHQFFFYGGTRSSHGEFAFCVHRATEHFRSGMEVKLGVDRSYIEKNIKKILTERDVFNLYEVAPEYLKNLSYIFDWIV